WKMADPAFITLPLEHEAVQQVVHALMTGPVVAEGYLAHRTLRQHDSYDPGHRSLGIRFVGLAFGCGPTCLK
ncbi:MAG: hypothetical protein ACE5Q3_10300, partial [Alphaproteobacteria bacterium]